MNRATAWAALTWTLAGLLTLLVLVGLVLTIAVAPITLLVLLGIPLGILTSVAAEKAGIR